MDARDFIKVYVPEVKDGKYLEMIYKLQKSLIDGYVKIEGLPQYPVNVNTKASQVLIKDFVGRVIEELAEGYESMMFIDELCEKNQNFLNSYKDKSDKDYQQCKNHLQNVGEEFADAMHFMVELLIYVNIQPEDIMSYMEKNYSSIIEKYLSKLGGNTLAIAMRIGGVILTNNNLDHYHQVDLISDDEDEDEELTLYQAASLYNAQLYSDIKKCLWDVAQHLNIARNFLKNKPWKQSQVMTDEVHFQEEIVNSFILMVGVFLVLNLDYEDIYKLYFWKNQSNHFRQNSKY